MEGPDAFQEYHEELVVFPGLNRAPLSFSGEILWHSRNEGRAIKSYSVFLPVFLSPSLACRGIGKWSKPDEILVTSQVWLAILGTGLLASGLVLSSRLTAIHRDLQTGSNGIRSGLPFPVPGTLDPAAKPQEGEVFFRNKLLTAKKPSRRITLAVLVL